MNKFFALFLTLFAINSAMAQDIELPAPDRTGGKPLMQALSERQSTRSFQNTPLTHQQLSDLLWAANGFNREDRRTAPTSQNRQELELYVVMECGIYFYDARNHRLRFVKAGDFRRNTGGQAFVGNAPVNILFVSDMDRATDVEAAHINAGFVSQNIYLFAASEGLGTVVRGSFDRNALAELLGLPENKRVILTQTVGHIE